MSEDLQRTQAESDRWQRQWKIFDRVLAATEQARHGLLDELCHNDPTLRREVSSLLDAHAMGTLVDKPLVDLRANVHEQSAEPEIDRYRLVESLGAGGMGQVFSARRTDGLHDELVAVKVLKRGLETDLSIRRFTTERKILARLSHPHIAGLLDGGSTRDGRPYLVMERVVGTPIDQYCDEHKLSIADRLELFKEICRAVHFAHQNLVVHRDLKPSNILISDQGSPKLLDFGIAKLLEPDERAGVTQLGSNPMTPQYASPEQLAGQVTTTATDLYSLGMLLYLLLGGDLPYRLESSASERPDTHPIVPPSKGIADRHCSEGLDRISTDRASTPAKLLQLLKGDLDNIVLMALAEHSEDRYPSAEALVADLDRWSHGLPVRARSGTVAYRARKFVHRHRVSVAVGISVFTALLLLVSLLLMQSRQLRDERDRVISERNRATSVSDFLVELFAIPDPTRDQGESVTARELLDRGVAQIETELASEPSVRGSLMLTMGRSMAGLGLYDEASDLLRRALDLRYLDEDADPESVAEASLRLAEVLARAGRYHQAEPLLQSALKIRRGQLEPGDWRIAEAHFLLGDLAFKQGHFELARREFGIAQSVARSADHPELLAKILDRHGVLLQNRGHPAAAQTLFDEAIRLYRQTNSRAWLAVTLNNSAWLAAEQGHFERADALYGEAEVIQRHLFAGDHPQLATTLANRGLLYSQQGELDEAEALLSQALVAYRAGLGAGHPKVALTLNNLASVETQRGKLGNAEAYYREALEIQEQSLGPEHADTANTLNNLAQALALAGRLQEAETLFHRALEVTGRALGPEHPRQGAIMCNLAEISQQQGKLELATDLFHRAVSILRKSSEKNPNLAAALTNLAALHQQKGDLAAAGATGREAVAAMRRSVGDGHPDVARTRVRLASLLLEQKAYVEAEQEARLALEIFRAKAPTAQAWIDAAEGIRLRSLEHIEPSTPEPSTP